ncbi:type I 3-dehydroquinate dehydratase [Nitrososphaera viennensis]|uniref:3-dehydroquinate dehydratase n=2 Tax=Nitrososphaera viennensis TaxID=1034015 RepID=A0A060HHF2_9ARCH|nr:type I 3-dehydroquinate dehydratase [Nitrososphaera viennensis]AIC14780.1 3-dehydroquinate dehydratase [Nitrososphaera viennensis EN76]UVS69735.1 type I 3-dehydroquinate dehydratase [Nitrososphaera viennensis]
MPLAKICASIAAENANDLVAQAKNAFDLGADFVEARLDFIVTPEQVMQAADGIDKDRAVFTLRSKSQGGRFSGTEEERVRLLRKLAEKRPMLIDVELETLQANDNLADYLELASIPTLVSWHDFEKTPPNDELADIIMEMRLYSNYVKVVTTARSVEDSVRLMSLYESAIGLHPIIFAMGEAGVMTRVLCALYGAPYTYAAVEKAVAPGQLTIAQMKQLYGSIRSR